MSDDVSQEDLDDAIIEDTAHCQCCHAPFVLGGNDDVYIEVDQSRTCGLCSGSGGAVDAPGMACPNCHGEGSCCRVATLSLCIECGKMVHDQYKQTLADADLCEHGVSCGDWCPECREEYEQARQRYEAES